MARIILEDLRGFSTVDLVLRSDFQLGQATSERISNIVTRLLAGEPLQYILHHARFHGMNLFVNPSVLIPRPETEALVDIIIDREGSLPDLHVLDLCTGSGCIALALARNLKFPTITATDLSPDALAVARRNASNLKINCIRFVEADLLAGATPILPSLDFIVSNPPYIAQSEAKDMDSNVLDHEPHQALFVPDSDPLIFYRAIADYGCRCLKPGGRLYLEINPIYTSQLSNLLSSKGYKNIEMLPDSQRLTRFILASLL